MPESKVHYGGDEALKWRVDALESSRGVANGIATLDGGGDVPLSQLGNVPGGGGGSSNAGDRASLTLAAFDSGAFLFPLAFADPQPSGGAVPAGWLDHRGRHAVAACRRLLGRRARQRNSSGTGRPVSDRGQLPGRVERVGRVARRRRTIPHGRRRRDDQPVGARDRQHGGPGHPHRHRRPERDRRRHFPRRLAVRDPDRVMTRVTALRHDG